ncbi:EEF1A lysine methyltransferase 4 [Paramyrothecium foliicola]|nr:EEF1A lysine methyltransferase 4 [Paramyrothecium foliicola]
MSEEDKQLSYAEYWDGRYLESKGDAPVHEWFRSFADLRTFFVRNLFETDGFKPEDNPVILHLGSGDSTIPAEFAASGYQQQLCVDFSNVVVKMMSERHSTVPGITWKNMDVRNMFEIPDKSIDVAFDKGTLDAMIHGSPWSPPEMVQENTRKYLGEVRRVLKDDGIFLWVTYRQPHFMKPLLNAGGLWDIDMQVLAEEGSFDYYGFVIKKAADSASDSSA